MDPHWDTAFVASGNGGGYDLAAWSVARGTVLWKTSYAAAKVYRSRSRSVATAPACSSPARHYSPAAA
jgi:hypothetical protein